MTTNVLQVESEHCLEETDDVRPVRRRDPSAARVLRLLDAFTSLPALAGVTQLADRAGLPKSTAHRLLLTLTREGYIERDGQGYGLTNRAFEIGNQASNYRPSGLRDQAMPFLTDLFTLTRQTVHLAVMQDGDVLYLEKIFGHSSRVATTVGGRKPPNATALGKAILAFSPQEFRDQTLGTVLPRLTPHTCVDRIKLEAQLAQIRSAGYALDRGESSLGVNCVAAPVRNPRTGRAIAALSVSTRLSPELARRFRNDVLESARALSRALVVGERLGAL
ncbi:IclR family transcriptional regulator [Arthrobacter sp. efr-133-TYG-118]|uniref:IclR family transcriptional regulator n=1 Tax=Arthrobacter sp. efr-133-TYG-118 TaxID=3040279 RepID=UPI00254FC6CF|nr:IclR family transcriptional regulator [Arthrobacter sp. efr-133-TYG-118]